jgi:20S proteasome alpha/beta subunit
MTLIIAAHRKEFIVVGADTREVIGTKVIRVEVNLADKIIETSPHVAILSAGQAGHALNLIDKFIQKNRKKDIGVTATAEKFSELCKEEAKADAKVPKHPDYVPNISFIVGGLDMSDGRFSVPKCYAITSYDGFICKPCKEGFAIEGKPMLAYYLFEKNYPKVKKPDEVCGLVAQTLYDTARIDGDVGFHFKMAIVRDNGFTWFSEGEIRDAFTKEKW